MKHSDSVLFPIVPSVFSIFLTGNSNPVICWIAHDQISRGGTWRIWWEVSVSCIDWGCFSFDFGRGIAGANVAPAAVHPPALFLPLLSHHKELSLIMLLKMLPFWQTTWWVLSEIWNEHGNHTSLYLQCVQCESSFGTGKKFQLLLEGPKTTKLLVDQEPFSEGDMRCAYKAQLVDGGGMLHDGAMYVLKHHLPAVINLWSPNYAVWSTVLSCLFSLPILQWGYQWCIG